MKTLLVITTLFVSVLAYTQEGFKWQKIGDVSKTQSQIYTGSKLFIANNWKSPLDVIKLDDEALGIIKVNGSIIKKISHSMNEWTYIYDYSVTFRMKEGRYNFTIDDVRCVKSYPGAGSRYSIAPLHPYEGDYDRYRYVKNKSTELTLPEEKASYIIKTLKSVLNDLFLSYVKFIEEPSVSDDW